LVTGAIPPWLRRAPRSRKPNGIVSVAEKGSQDESPDPWQGGARMAASEGWWGLETR
jgi:hypothetical protein